MAQTKTYTSDLDYDGPGRNILIFLDGTWNDENGKNGDGITTNIYRLFRSIFGDFHDGDTPFRITNEKQIALYFRGVGNDDDNDTFGTFYEGAFGAGERRIRDNAYSEIVKHYRKGDRILIFGFSRGAACARLLASKLQVHGILKSIKVTFKQRNRESFFLKYDKKDKAKVDADVHFLGIFDTVGAFGIPINILGLPFQKINLFKNLKVASNVKKVVHCVAIDESRDAFIPTLCDKSDRVEEVWFAGVHSDIGGGYRYAELGKISLSYLVKKLKENTVDKPIEFDSNSLKKHTKYSAALDKLRMHYHGDGAMKSQRKIFISVKSKNSAHRPKVHKSVLDLMKAPKLSLAESFASFTTMTPITYFPQNLKDLNDSFDIVD